MTPDWLIVILSLAALASGIGAIAANYHSRGRDAFFVLKPLTTVLILLLVLGSPAAPENLYAILIVVALLFSLAGDVLLMLSSQYFILGLLSFSVTHVMYCFAFALATGIMLVHLPLLFLALIAFAVVRLIWIGVRRSLRAAVLLYVLLITVMAGQATGAAIAQHTASSAIAAVGAVFFFVSDAILAIDRFRFPFPAARAATLSSYWLGQWLIAISTKL